MPPLRARVQTRCSRPLYPTQLAVRARPDLLRRYMPEPWCTRRELGVAAGTLLALTTTACARTKPAPGIAPDGPIVVAPLFEHGDGRGATGCIVTAPPAFLSEDEALQVIREELAQAGMRDWQEDVTLPQVRIVARYIHFDVDWVSGDLGEHIEASPEDARALEVDLVDPARRVAVEFVSSADYHDLGGPQFGASGWSSVSHYDFHEVATYIGDQALGAREGQCLAVLYDPVSTYQGRLATLGDSPPKLEPSLTKAERDARWDEWEQARQKEDERRKKEAIDQSKQLLREQVKDFIDWLKAQGVI